MKAIIYTTSDGKSRFSLQKFDEQLWLTQLEIAELYQTTKQNISKHIKAIFLENEIDEKATVNFQLTVQNEGGRNIKRKMAYYPLPLIIAVGYRVRSSRGTQFRQWATQCLGEYIKKGFALDDERLKGTGGGDYFKELLERIRDIRSSEKAMYRQVLDLYATSYDYDPKSDESIKFFKIVQNKLHYAVSEQTASEIIFSRVNGDKEFMGLTNFKGQMPTLNEAKTAKNYLSEDELFRLNRLVSAFFDLAEVKAHEREPMYMRDWISELDKFSVTYGKGVLQNAGSVSHSEAMKKVDTEYAKYRQNNLTPVEKEYINAVKSINLKLKDKGKK
ncbi:RhuM family protein [uncultured Campylobacter sp.]|jgi:DNA-binding protein|uniref:virulence RhuM family protein n=1 Tax=uncultured Campylobacter sp. TaxID=218934 RepID=UPI0026208112|nr:RhuM family protein [uncultured Campylobacter sp.]